MQAINSMLFLGLLILNSALSCNSSDNTEVTQGTYPYHFEYVFDSLEVDIDEFGSSWGYDTYLDLTTTGSKTTIKGYFEGEIENDSVHLISVGTKKYGELGYFNG